MRACLSLLMASWAWYSRPEEENAVRSDLERLLHFFSRFGLR